MCSCPWKCYRARESLYYIIYPHVYVLRGMLSLRHEEDAPRSLFLRFIMKKVRALYCECVYMNLYLLMRDGREVFFFLFVQFIKEGVRRRVICSRPLCTRCEARNVYKRQKKNNLGFSNRWTRRVKGGRRGGGVMCCVLGHILLYTTMYFTINVCRQPYTHTLQHPRLSHAKEINIWSRKYFFFFFLLVLADLGRMWARLAHTVRFYLVSGGDLKYIWWGTVRDSCF